MICKPFQAMRATYGLRGVPSYYPVFQDERDGLSCMDAPTQIPLGSMARRELPKGTVMLFETTAHREHA